MEECKKQYYNEQIKLIDRTNENTRIEFRNKFLIDLIKDIKKINDKGFYEKIDMIKEIKIIDSCILNYDESKNVGFVEYVQKDIKLKKIIKKCDVAEISEHEETYIKARRGLNKLGLLDKIKSMTYDTIKCYPAETRRWIRCVIEHDNISYKLSIDQPDDSDDLGMKIKQISDGVNVENDIAMKIYVVELMRYIILNAKEKHREVFKMINSNVAFGVYNEILSELADVIHKLYIKYCIENQLKFCDVNICDYCTINGQSVDKRNFKRTYKTKYAELYNEYNKKQA